MEALFKQDAKRKWPSIHLTHFERQGHIWLYTDFTLWSPYCSAQTLQCEQHMVLHKLYTETSYGSFRDFTIWTPYGYTDFYTARYHCSTQTLQCGQYMVLHKLYTETPYGSYRDFTLRTPYGSTQTFRL